MISRRSFLAGMAAAAALVAVGGPAHAAAGQAPAAFVENLAQQAIDAMADKSVSEQERLARFHTLFVSNFDLPEIGKFVLGRHWRAASSEQQQQFLALFEELNVLTWAKRFKEYKGEKLMVTNSLADGERGVVVESLINRPQGAPAIPVNWRLRQPDGTYKVVDITVEGVSMALTQRSDYTAAIQGNGGNLDGLLEMMRKKIATLKQQG